MSVSVATFKGLGKLATAAEFLVDRRVGIIRQVGEYLREPGDPEFYCYFAKACNTSAFSKHKNFSDTGGVSIDRNIALAKALGEAVERYCAALYDEAEFPFVSKREAPFECIDPHLFNLNTEEQYNSSTFPLSQFTENTRIRWVPATELSSGTVKFVPAQAVYVPYSGGKKTGQEPLICQPISTGLACHESFEQAALSAICEVIERDAFTITWQGGLSRSHIAIESLSPTNQEIAKRLMKPSCQLDLLDITLDSQVPTILSTLRFNESNAPALVVATSTELNPELAVRKSLEELAYTRRYSQYLLENTPPVENKPPNDHIHNQGHHLRFWCDHANASSASFLYSSPDHINFENLPLFETKCVKENLKLIGEKIKSTGYEIYLVDITTADIRSLGLSVVRAIIPGYHPLRMGHQVRATTGCRLMLLPSKLGLIASNHKVVETNLPHAFP